MRSNRNVARWVTGHAVLAVALTATASAAAGEFRLEGATLPAPLLEGGRVNAVIEASGVQPIGDGRRFLVAHDKAPELYVIEASSGRILGEPLTSPRFPKANKGGPKWEGMAFDADGHYYVVGSHSGKTDEERALKGVLVRFRLAPSEEPAIDDASVSRLQIGRGLAAALKAEGVDQRSVDKRKIEGLAVRALRGEDGQMRKELVVGLRQPNDKVRAFAADITTLPKADEELALKPVFAFEAEPREGVTSELTALEYVPALGGFLVVTATEDENNAFHGNSLWFVADGETARAEKLGTFEVAMKAEGLAVLGAETDGKVTRMTLLITFDNDTHTTKIPSRFQTVRLVRERP